MAAKKDKRKGNDQFFVENEIPNDTILRAAKKKIQDESKQAVLSGAAKQEDLYFIPASMLRNATFKYKP